MSAHNCIWLLVFHLNKDEQCLLLNNKNVIPSRIKNNYANNELSVLYVREKKNQTNKQSQPPSENMDRKEKTMLTHHSSPAHKQFSKFFFVCVANGLSLVFFPRDKLMTLCPAINLSIKLRETFFFLLSSRC